MHKLGNAEDQDSVGQMENVQETISVSLIRNEKKSRLRNYLRKTKIMIKKQNFDISIYIFFICR